MKAGSEEVFTARLTRSILATPTFTWHEWDNKHISTRRINVKPPHRYFEARRLTSQTQTLELGQVKRMVFPAPASMVLGKGFVNHSKKNWVLVLLKIRAPRSLENPF